MGTAAGSMTREAILERVSRRQVGPAPRGTHLACKGWGQEAALRMLMNNLDPEVAERPEALVVYGGAGKAARSWEAYAGIVRSLLDLEDDETLLVQSGKAVGVFRTHPDAPRVLLANALLVPKWTDLETFLMLERQGLTMYGQMTAGSWIYIGTQGILQGTYETLAAAARAHFGGTLRGRLVVSAGLGGMGGAQPLAVTMNEGVFLGIEVDPARILRRIKTGYCHRMTVDLGEALAWAEEAKAAGWPLSVGCVGNAAEVLPALVERGVVPDLLTDQTAAHDPLNGYIPRGFTLEAAAALRERDPHPADVISTFLGAHAVPPEFASRPDAYVECVVEEMLPAVAAEGLAEFCDVFCEEGYFTPAQSQPILRAAARRGLKAKIHADEFSASGGAEVAAAVGAVSADHLLSVTEGGIQALKAAGVVTTLLPGTAAFLGLGRYAPARAMLAAGLTVALATDFKPGTCMTESIPLIMNLACTQMRMSPEEALLAATMGGAAALARTATVGSLRPGKQADILILDSPNHLHLAYHFGVNPVRTVVKRGRVVVEDWHLAVPRPEGA